MSASILFRSIGALLILGSLVNCSDKQGDSAEPAAKVVPAATEPPKPMIEGNWQSTCVSASDFGISESTIVDITQGSATFTTRTSREADCSLPDVEIIQVASYLAPEASTNNSNIKNIDFGKTVVRVKPVSPAGLSTLMIRQFCGTDKWVLDQEIDVTEAVQKGKSNCVKLMDQKQIFQIQNDTLFFGLRKGTNGTEVNRTQFFVRKPAASVAAAVSNK